MALQDAEAQRQIQQMVNFILNEARDKAQEIEAKALEDFNIEKLKLVQQMKNKVRQEYSRKAKQLEVERAIARSTAINRSRLRKIGARSAVVDEVVHLAAQQLSKVAADNPDKYKKLCVELIAQGLLILLEPEVLIRCRPEDQSIISECLAPAAQLFSETIRREAGVEKKVRLQIDRDNLLLSGPTSKSDTARTCAGGITITSSDRKIVIDNTFDTRLRLVIKDCLPTVRKTLFPVH